MNGNVIKLFKDETYYAACPECGGTEWLLPVNGPDDTWDKIEGTRCANPDCNFYMVWVLAEKDEKEAENE